MALIRGFNRSYFPANNPLRVICGPVASIGNMEEAETSILEQAVDVIPTEETGGDLGGHRDSSPSTHPLFTRLWIHDIGMIGSLKSPLNVILLFTLSLLNLECAKIFTLKIRSNFTNITIVVWTYPDSYSREIHDAALPNNIPASECIWLKYIQKHSLFSVLIAEVAVSIAIVIALGILVVIWMRKIR